MANITSRTGKGSAITQGEYDNNVNYLNGTHEADATTSRTVDQTDHGKTIEFTSASAVTVTLDSIATIQAAMDSSVNDFIVCLINTGSNVVTINKDAGDTFNVGTSVVLNTDEVAILQTSGTTQWNVITTRRNLFDGVTAGTVTASKAVVVDASKDIGEFSTITSVRVKGTSTLEMYADGANFVALNYSDGTGGVNFYDGATGLVASVDNAGEGTFTKITSTVFVGDLTGDVTGNVTGSSGSCTGNSATATTAGSLSGVTSTAAELNIMDGSATTQATVALALDDGVVISDADTMKQCLVSDFAEVVHKSTGGQSDLNDDVISGIKQNLAGHTNFPLPTADFGILTVHSFGAIITQSCQTVSTTAADNRVYVRSSQNTGSTWTAWQQL